MTHAHRPGLPLLDDVLRLTIGDRPVCLLRDALEAPIPAGVKRYLVAEIVARLDADLSHAPLLRRVLGTTERVRRTRHAILRGIAPLLELDRSEIHTLLGEALEFTAEHLTQPRSAIERRLTAHHPVVTLEAIRSYFDRTADYGYLPHLIEELFRRRGTGEVGAEEFRGIVARIDDEVVGEHDPGEMVRLAKPIFDFALGRSSGPGDPIPLELILRFLEDKRMTIVREYIEGVARLRERATITREELAGYFADLSGATRDEEAPGPAGDATAAPLLPEAVPTAGPVSPDPGPAEEIPFFLPDLQRLIGEKERQRFIRHVFRKDQAYFSGVVGTLNTLLTWGEASAYLQQVYSVSRLNPFDKEVVEFTDLVHRRYTAGGHPE